MSTLGWDIGGVNTKVARVAGDRVLAVRSRPFELQRDPAALVQVLRTLAAESGASAGDVHAVTMTAELSQMFRTKREGVSFVLDSIEAAFPGGRHRCVSRLMADSCRRRRHARNRSRWRPPTGRPPRDWPRVTCPMRCSWTSARPARTSCPSSTETLRRRDGPIPIAWRRASWSTPALCEHPLKPSSAHVPFGDGEAGLSAEGFALAGDVHVWRGDLTPADYTAPTPDGRPPTREFAGERLAGRFALIGRCWTPRA